MSVWRIDKEVTSEVMKAHKKVVTKSKAAAERKQMLSEYYERNKGTRGSEQMRLRAIRERNRLIERVNMQRQVEAEKRRKEVEERMLSHLNFV